MCLAIFVFGYILVICTAQGPRTEAAAKVRMDAVQGSFSD